MRVARARATLHGMTDTDLIARYDGRVPRYTSYPTAPHFHVGIGADTYDGWLEALPADTPISLYLHVPFCDRLCLYCGCNTTVVRKHEPRRAYAALLESELRQVAAHIGRRVPVAAVHWGGGTPTTLPGDCLISIMEVIRTAYDVLPDAEIAIEIDPTALPADRLAALPVMGINRVSLGVQDFEPAVQTAIGRIQTYGDTQSCAASLRGLGIGSLNLDLIYGLPHQTEASVIRTARQVLDLKADRIAVFGYAHVPWMKRHQALIPDHTLPGPAARFAQRRAIGDILEREGGFIPVGLDHYARLGDAMADAVEQQSLHRSFQGYTTDAAAALIGIGASAIGGLPQGYVQNATGVPAYADAIKSGKLATARGVALTPDDRLRRDLIEQIMCDLEADILTIAAAHGADAAPLLENAAGLDLFVADGLAEWNGRRVVVTEAGRPFVRNVAALFDAYLVRNTTRPLHAQAV
jgi:oxygen-independent coproporphyrinogen-3 oxidase